jgi:hypothetical protein
MRKLLTLTGVGNKRDRAVGLDCAHVGLDREPEIYRLDSINFLTS